MESLQTTKRRNVAPVGRNAWIGEEIWSRYPPIRRYSPRWPALLGSASGMALRARVSTSLRRVGTRYGPCIVATLAAASSADMPTADTNSGDPLSPRHISIAPVAPANRVLATPTTTPPTTACRGAPRPGAPSPSQTYPSTMTTSARGPRSRTPSKQGNSRRKKLPGSYSATVGKHATAWCSADAAVQPRNQRPAATAPVLR